MSRYGLILIMLMVNLSPLSSSHAQACSAGDNTPTTITFYNYSDVSLEFFWVNFDCVEQSYGQLFSGQVYEQPTYDGHEWVLRDSAGNEVGRMTASADGTNMLTIGDPFIPPTHALDFDYRPAEGEQVVIEDADGCVVEDVTPDLGLDPFYQRYCTYEGVLIASSDQVPDAALKAAWIIMANMLQNQPEVLAGFKETNLKIGIVAQSEGITVLPEYAFLRDDPVTNWDERARGLGGNPAVPLGSGAEENLLCYPDDSYLGESIFLHELAHTLKDTGIALADPKFNPALQLAYEAAQTTGLWENTYAMSTVDEYWAEGVQAYFNTNLERIPSDGIHNEINTREELASYDPTLYAIIDTVFAGLEWSPTCPE